MTNVVALPTAVPDPEIIAMAEALLARAKAGEVRGFAYITVTNDYAYQTAWNAGIGSSFMSLLYMGTAFLRWRMEQDKFNPSNNV